MSSAAQANTLLDKLTLELLDLVEQQVRCQLDIEDSVINGQLLIAKTRYTLGKNSVTTAQLPTENSVEFEALANVTRASSESCASEIADSGLVLQRQTVDKEAARPEPLKWFGILLPQSMHGAQRMFVRAVERSVECANIQLSLQSAMQNILNLRGRVAAASA